MTKEWTNIFEGAHNFFGKLCDTRICYLSSVLTVKAQRGQFKGMWRGAGGERHTKFLKRIDRKKEKLKVFTISQESNL